MIVDTSAWVEFARGSGAPVVEAVRQAVAGSAMTTDIIRLELLAGASPEIVAIALQAALDRCIDIAQQPLIDVEAAAKLFRTCRRAGETVRSPNDCLIAAIAIRAEVPVLHNDRDFDVIARYSALEAVRG